MNAPHAAFARPHDWMRLDNAATIYPAAQRRNWSALFRVSATLHEPIDPAVLSQALTSVLHRAPAFSYRLRRGMFWHYMERSESRPPIQPDVGNPCVPFKPKNNGGFSFRVRYYDCRIAVEFFHVLTDGTGGLIFLKTLTAEYLRLKYGADIPRGNGILDCQAQPRPEEFEDGYAVHAGEFTQSRAEKNAFRIRGDAEPDEMVHITTGSIPVAELQTRARALGASITEYLTALLILSVDDLQKKANPIKRFHKPVKINVPVNLRTLFPSETLRNFASYVNPGIDPRLGEYTLPEVVSLVHHQMRAEITKKSLNAKFTTNVRSAGNALLRVVPLFLKNLVKRSVFMQVGDKRTCTCFSNLGRVELPAAMARYVTRMDFILGPLSINKLAVAALSYDGVLRIHFTRTIRQPDLERTFFTRLVKLGVPVQIESNQR